ncbi:MAG: hypothetical protein ACTSQY_02705 [Candidatus Odinarchaeia archaeon]
MQITFPLPVKGFSAGFPVSSQAPATSGYMLNCRPIDVLEQRMRIGQRAGLDKAYTQQIGGTGAQPVKIIKSVTIVNETFTESVYENLATGDDTGTYIYGVNWQSQTFTVSTSHRVTKVALYGGKQNNPTTDVIVSIRAVDDDGKPTGGDLCVGNASPVSWTAFSWLNVELGSGVVLEAGVKYAIVVRLPGGDGTDRIEWRRDNADGYASGQRCGSTDSGSTWGSLSDNDFLFREYGLATAVNPAVNYTKKLVAISNNQVWYETSLGTMEELAAANGEIQTLYACQAVEAYGKLFIVNKTNLKVLDFVNVKITTADVLPAGKVLPLKGDILTGETSGAEMVVDYIDATDGACNIYGYRTTTETFQNAEDVVGSNINGMITFATNATESSGPFFYDWTVYANDTTTYGTMPTSSSLIALYRGRLVINDDKKPHAWTMFKVGDPWKCLYDYTNDGDLSAVTHANAKVGEIGDVLRAFVPYKDDLFVFGCVNSMWVLIGDAVSGGQLAKIPGVTGIWGPSAWCMDDRNNLYFLGLDGLYRVPIAESLGIPENLSKTFVPKLINDLNLDNLLHEVILEFDPVNQGILIHKTAIANGANSNWWYDLRLNGFFEETYPNECGVHCSHYYKATNETYTKLLLGGNDGYIREFLLTAKDDDAGASGDTAISSYCTLPIQPLAADGDHAGKLTSLTIITAGGAADGNFGDTDGVSYELHKADDAETCLENIVDGADAIESGTLSGTGRKERIRKRVRGAYLGIKLYNSTADETWSIEKIIGKVEPAGRLK